MHNVLNVLFIVIFTNCICIVFIVCSVAFIVCGVCVLWLIVVPLPSGKNSFAVKINNNNNNQFPIL
jgi:hypothetical protein